MLIRLNTSIKRTAPTLKKTHHVSIIKTNRLILFTEIITARWEVHMKQLYSVRRIKRCAFYRVQEITAGSTLAGEPEDST
jgi:hypothetical protein